MCLKLISPPQANNYTDHPPNLAMNNQEPQMNTFSTNKNAENLTMETTVATTLEVITMAEENEDFLHHLE